MFSRQQGTKQGKNKGPAVERGLPFLGTRNLSQGERHISLGEDPNGKAELPGNGPLIMCVGCAAVRVTMLWYLQFVQA
jgi:hypothetical protein